MQTIPIFKLAEPRHSSSAASALPQVQAPEIASFAAEFLVGESAVLSSAKLSMNAADQPIDITPIMLGETGAVFEGPNRSSEASRTNSTDGTADYISGKDRTSEHLVKSDAVRKTATLALASPDVLPPTMLELAPWAPQGTVGTAADVHQQPSVHPTLLTENYANFSDTGVEKGVAYNSEQPDPTTRTRFASVDIQELRRPPERVAASQHGLVHGDIAAQAEFDDSTRAPSSERPDQNHGASVANPRSDDLTTPESAMPGSKEIAPPNARGRADSPVLTELQNPTQSAKSQNGQHPGFSDAVETATKALPVMTRTEHRDSATIPEVIMTDTPIPVGPGKSGKEIPTTIASVSIRQGIGSAFNEPNAPSVKSFPVRDVYGQNAMPVEFQGIPISSTPPRVVARPEDGRSTANAKRVAVDTPNAKGAWNSGVEMPAINTAASTRQGVGFAFNDHDGSRVETLPISEVAETDLSVSHIDFRGRPSANVAEQTAAAASPQPASPGPGTAHRPVAGPITGSVIDGAGRSISAPSDMTVSTHLPYERGRTNETRKTDQPIGYRQEYNRTVPKHVARLFGQPAHAGVELAPAKVMELAAVGTRTTDRSGPAPVSQKVTVAMGLPPDSKPAPGMPVAERPTKAAAVTQPLEEPNLNASANMSGDSNKIPNVTVSGQPASHVPQVAMSPFALHQFAERPSHDPEIDLPAELVANADALSPTRDSPSQVVDVKLARQTIQQIAEMVRQMPDRPVEISLNPEELGRVKMTLTATDGALSVSLVSERSETADLLRRNIEMLSQEIKDLGYESISFSFEGYSRGEHHNEPGHAPEGPHTAADLQETVAAPQAARIALGSSVDIRL